MPMIREATPADRPALLDLWVEAWVGAMPEIDFEGRRAWFSDHLDELAGAGAVLLVICDDAVPTGFITVDAKGTVDQLAVAPRCQGLGLARDLLAAARARSSSGLSLSVNSDNHRAVRFYEKQGFRVVDRGINPRSGLPILHMAG